ncbi:MAG: hybrid sensor histidine kinase/response regulator, partial [Caulobacteraceae bacterium]|nr:hybrid sensor histidine kinase/response regulator [Caulobacteraceae bacterium]
MVSNPVAGSTAYGPTRLDSSKPNSGPPKARPRALSAAQLAELEAVARQARELGDCRMACVAMIEGDQLRFVGLGEAEPQTARRSGTLVDRSLRKRDLAWVQDASREKSLAADPFVEGRKEPRFYACAPIILEDGFRAGALVIQDRRVRPYDGEFADQLKALARQAAQAWSTAPAKPAAAPATIQPMLSVLEDAPVGVVVTDREMRILGCSRAWRELRGLGPEIVGKTLYEAHPGARERWEASYQECLAGQEIKADRLQMQLPGGEPFWVKVHMAPWREAAGAIGGLMIMTHDITDMVTALDASQRSERRLRLALDLGKLFVWEFDYTRGEFNTGDPDARENKAAIAKAQTGIWERIHPDDQPAAMALWNAHMQEGEPYRMDYRVKGSDGGYTWAAVAAEAVRDEEGRIERVIGMTRNIDQERQAEAALEEALHSAEAANRAKSEFLANMSHEIRTPLNGVLGVAGALAKTGLTPDQQDMVGLIEGSAQTLGRLLADILDLARIESGRLILKHEDFNLGEIIHATSGLFEPDARAKGLTLRCDVGVGADQPVRGDGARVRQIVSNLISNAVKFTDAGEVVVAARAQSGAEGVLAITLSVTDTGVGFDDALAARLFNRFEQADGSSTRRAQGAGLGLAISRSLAEAMGGSLIARSTPGEGSIFTLQLRLRPARAKRAPKAAVAETGCEVGARVLLAEDHPTNRKVVELILGSVGVDLTVVENGQEAVDAAAATPFDLILMDMQMPVMDGLT